MLALTTVAKPHIPVAKRQIPAIRPAALCEAEDTRAPSVADEAILGVGRRKIRVPEGKTPRKKIRMPRGLLALAVQVEVKVATRVVDPATWLMIKFLTESLTMLKEHPRLGP